jgi:AraC family transcriptional activator of tynA and feaB
MTEVQTNRTPTTRQSDEWRSLQKQACSNDLAALDQKTFVGWFQPFSAYGFKAINAGSNIARVDRMPKHARLDGLEDYSIIFQLSGRSAIDQNDTLHELATGDLTLFDPVRQTTVFNQPGIIHHMALHLPRRELVAHLGFEPKGPLHRGGTVANRLLLQLMTEALQASGPSDALPEAQMRLVMYDLLAALFTPPEGERVSTYTDKLFTQICGIVQARLADPELTPSTVAAEARISMRYLQKLFSARGTTCGHYIHSLRLDQASRLLQRRSLSSSGEPLGDIAFACGFLDYPHFSRKFRERFGHSPSAHSASAVRKQTSRMALSD